MKYVRIKIESKILLFLVLSCLCPAQNIAINNKSNFPIEVKYAQKKVDIGVNQKKALNLTNEVKNISVLYKNDKKIKRNIFLFLNPQDSLNINLKQDSVKFTGDKSALHDFVYGKMENDLTLKISEYQKYYQNNDAKGFIRTSEMYLADVLKKAERLNSSPSGREDVNYKEIEKIAKDRWFFTVFVSFGSNKLTNTEKQLMLYYFEKYFKKDIATFSCNSWVDYDILRRYSLHRKLLNLKLPKYDIIEHTDEDEINQYLPPKCQEYYFRSSYDFWVHKKDLVRAEKYKKILIEKFHANF
ncbi:hypothetical protein [Chryseobacterium sp. POE27]|uniref:hypothetical protein n=1 Tax=Chryseobacterium sp. POE27 TaxID=3138177 RepID=UPI00321A725B